MPATVSEWVEPSRIVICSPCPARLTTMPSRTFAAYVAPTGWWQKPIAVAAVIILATVNYYGITRTASLTKIIVAFVLATLALVVVASLSGATRGSVGSWDLLAGGWYGILQSAGLLFFAFAGYARIATMGEEVRDPERTIPRAILTALSVVVLIYLVVGVSILMAFSPCRGGPPPAATLSAMADEATSRPSSRASAITTRAPFEANGTSAT